MPVSQPPSAPTASPEQRDAVQAPIGPVLVLAGPGAGKTFCLIERVRYLIEHHGAAPERICAVTFTNKAAEEIGTRLHRELGGATRSDLVHRGTIHALCCEVLREHGERVGVARGFGIADEDLQHLVLRRLGAYAYKRRQWLLSQFGRHRLLGAPVEPDVAALCTRYLDVLRSRRLVDFDDLVLLVDRLFSAEPAVAQGVAARWDHLLVDEFQDLNPPQYRIVRGLAEPHRSIFAVGDDEQSIFSWTGADPRVLDRFRTDFAIAHPIALEENHRCSRTIFSVARRLVERNATLFDKRIAAVREVAIPVVAHAFPDERTEAAWIVSDVCARRAASGGALTWGDFGVLYRHHDIGDVLEQALVRAGVPCRLAKGRALTDDPVIAQVLASLRVIEDEADSLAVEALAARVLPEDLIERVRAALPKGQEGDFLAAVREIARRAPPGDPARKPSWRLVYQVENLRALARTDTTLPALILEILGHRMGRWQNALEERAEQLTDPAADPEVVELAAALEAVIAEGSAVWIAPGGVAIGMRAMLVRSELFPTVRYRLAGDGPASGDLVLEADGAPAALRLFKALQLVQTRAVRDPFAQYVAFDFETTDPNSATCEVVEIGAVRVVNRVVVDSFQALVRPTQPISPGATAIHGYTIDDLAGAKTFDQVWPAFRAFVADDVLLAHNGQLFDVPVLRRLAAGLPGVDDLRFFDSLPLARAVITDGSAKLEVLAERFGVERGRSHHALDDARTLAGVYGHLARLQEARARKTAQVQLLDGLGLALAADWDEEAEGERQEFQAVAPRLTLGRYSDALEFYSAERERAPGLLAPPVEVIIERLGGRAKMELLRRERAPSDRYAAALRRLEALVAGSAADTLVESIRRLLERVALSTSREAETDPERVNLLTLHSTKGLEYAQVYVVGVEDERLPGVRAVGDAGIREIEEARRLLYVGMTRARDRLVLTRVERRGGKDTGGGMFLGEMGIEPQLP